MECARSLVTLGLLLALAFTTAAQAEVKLSGLFSDHMVLQRDHPIPIWGTAAPGEKVAVSLSAQEASATADAAGKWKAVLPGLSAGGPHTLTVVGGNTLTVKDVLIGEVWLAAGQSNMHFALRNATGGPQAAAQPTGTDLRFFVMPQWMSTEPQSEARSRWVVGGPETTHVSAVAFFFARELERRLHVPVGILQATWSGSPLEPFMDRETLERDPEHAGLRTQLARATKDPKLLEAEDWPSVPTSVFNTLVHPLIPYAMRGAIWYQGEGNVGQSTYGPRFQDLITGWRRAWGQGEFPFLFVQLVGVGGPPNPEGPGDSERAELREAQATALALPHTGMAVAIDLGEGRNAHPPRKREVGLRLALLAGHEVYGWKGEYTGPTYEGRKGDLTITGPTVRLRLSHTMGGLVVQGEPPVGFALAGKDRRFYWADVDTENDEVILSSPKVPHPVAARYAWGDLPPCGLFNSYGLPAAPFRTDRWPGVSTEPEND